MKHKIPVLSLAVIIIFILAGIACHPYYNAFYNAEEAYSDAQRKHRKAMRNYPDSLIVAPSPEIGAKYDRAIEKSLNMMEIYPKARKYQDRAHYLMGRSSFYKMDFSTAVSRLRDLQVGYPESPLVPPSQIYVAKAHILMDNLMIAEEILLNLLAEHPRLDRNHEITMLLVDIAMRRGGRSQALGLLEGISLSGLPIERRIDIILRMADLQYIMMQYPRALGLLNTAPRIKKLPYLMYRIDRSIYFCRDAMDELDVSLQHLAVMEKNKLYRDRRDEIIYYKAITLRRMGRLDEALALLDGIRQKCGKAAQSDTMSLCGRSAYELANIYLMLGDLDKAMEAYAEAVESGDSLMASRVSSRLAALGKLRELRKPDSTGRIPAGARYSIAELFQFDLEAPDSAYVSYMGLVSGPGADSLMRPRALLMSAMLLREALADTLRSDSLFRMVVRDYGGTEYARRAQIEMDEPTAETPREAVEREFRTAEALTETDMVGAVKAFYSIYKEYPDMDIAPKSLYAAAWYTDRGLQKKRAAMTLYEELCKRYPNSDFCKLSASPRLAAARDSIKVREKRREQAKAARAAEAADPSGAMEEPAADDGGDGDDDL